MTYKTATRKELTELAEEMVAPTLARIQEMEATMRSQVKLLTSAVNVLNTKMNRADKRIHDDINRNRAAIKDVMKALAKVENR